MFSVFNHADWGQKSKKSLRFAPYIKKKGKGITILTISDKPPTLTLYLSLSEDGGTITTAERRSHSIIRFKSIKAR